MFDRYGRRINYLRLSVTDLCNLRCRYCMPINGIEKKEHEEILSFEEINEIVNELIDLGIDKVRITGGEPLVRKDLTKLIKNLRQHNGIKEITITTNGVFLEEKAFELKAAGVDRVNISLDTLDPVKYEYMTRGGNLYKVQSGIIKAIEAGLKPLKLNCVLIGGFNDDEISHFVKITKDYPIDVRFIELMPIGEVASWNNEKFINSSRVLEKDFLLYPVQKIDMTSPANYYKIPDGKGRVALIQPISCKFCKDCNRIRLTSDGKLKYCLHSDDELDLKQVLRSGGSIKTSVLDYIKEKPFEHGIEKGKYVKRSMVRVGG